MELRCTACGFTKEVDEARLPPGRLKVSCKHCGATFEVDRADGIELEWGGRAARDPRHAEPASAIAVRAEMELAPADGLRTLLEAGTVSKLLLRQQVRSMELLTGLESAARYDVWSAEGSLIGHVGERSPDLAALAMRWLLKAQRPFEMRVDGNVGGLVMELKRGWFWFQARLEVWDPEGTLVGTVEQRWRFFQRRFELVAPSGQVLGRIISEFMHPWTFPVFAGPESRQRQVGLIQKKWGGFLREAFTDADKYAITLPEGDPALRYLVFAAALLIDFGYFEHGSQARTGNAGTLFDVARWFS